MSFSFRSAGAEAETWTEKAGKTRLTSVVWTEIYWWVGVNKGVALVGWIGGRRRGGWDYVEEGREGRDGKEVR